MTGISSRITSRVVLPRRKRCWMPRGFGNLHQTIGQTWFIPSGVSAEEKRSSRMSWSICFRPSWLKPMPQRCSNSNGTSDSCTACWSQLTAMSMRVQIRVRSWDIWSCRSWQDINMSSENVAQRKNLRRRHMAWSSMCMSMLCWSNCLRKVQCAKRLTSCQACWQAQWWVFWRTTSSWISCHPLEIQPKCFSLCPQPQQGRLPACVAQRNGPTNGWQMKTVRCSTGASPSNSMFRNSVWSADCKDDALALEIPGISGLFVDVLNISVLEGSPLPHPAGWADITDTEWVICSVEGKPCQICLETKKYVITQKKN